MADWSPKDYLKFADERSRPARDLLAQVPLATPSVVYDLGCGPGNSTELLVAAWPRARVTGIDNSSAMLEAARKFLPQVAFINADLVNWVSAEPADLLFSNATLQWVPDHLAVMVRMVGCLKTGGVLAVQMPDNLDEPSHALMREVAEEGPWADRLRVAAAVRERVRLPTNYYNALKPWCSRVDIWHTIYNHPLDGAEGIVQWLSSTGLRPFLAPLADGERATFLQRYRENIARAYPAASDGKVLLRFPRLFIVALKA